MERIGRGRTGTGTGRREFLKGVAAGALLGGAAAAQAQNGQAARKPDPLPHVTIGGHRIPRMIVGCNPIGGWSHSIRNMTLAMTDYFDLPTTVKFLQRCESFGLTTWLTYWADKPRAALKTLYAQGSRIRPYYLGSLDAEGRLARDILEYKPLFYVHHGNDTDMLFRAGKHQKVHDFVKRVHDEMGLPAGVSCHNPDCVKHMEEKGWEVDFYQTCLYYVTRPKSEIRAKLGTAMLGEPFLESDRDNMLKVIQQASKPCIAFKILAAGWHCDSDESVEEAFAIALGGIKKTDAILVGMWPKFKDEIAQNVYLLRKYGAA